VRGGIDVSAAGIVPLTGEWEVLEDTSRPAAESLPEYDELPRAWDSPFGYAAYRIRVRGLDPHEDYALKLYYQATSFRVSIDGKEVFSGGTPGRTEEETRPFFLSGVAAVPAGVGTAELVLETANFSHRRGGPTRAILLGPASEIRRYEARATFKDAAAIILCLVMGCVFFLNAAVRRQASSLFLGLIYVFCGLMVFLVSAEMFVGRIFPRLDWALYERTSYIATHLTALWVLLAARSLFGGFSRGALGLIVLPLGILCAVVDVAPPSVFTRVNPLLQLNSILLAAAALAVCGRGVRKRYPYAKSLTAGFVVLFCIGVSSILFANNRICDGQFLALFFFYNLAGPSVIARQVIDLASYACLFVLVNVFSLNFFLDSPKRSASAASLAAPDDVARSDQVRERCLAEGLSARETEVTILALRGKTNGQIRDTLFISLSTVKTHMSRILRKTGTKTRSELFFHYMSERG